ncbi:HAD family hydrolase [Streptomyces lincolnensis]|uniref:HAD family hydrolase n=1 Tax=Streptomyces lincolnensis TaxID=1915 RepID=A0A1B1MNW3_STRLN|nr:HAD family hydrolase [Streptomyces lincolnensis]ANS70207.1 HAD family hydrolase [Streptomyces lincolnensis]
MPQLRGVGAAAGQRGENQEGGHSPVLREGPREGSRAPSPGGIEETAYRELTAPDAWLPYRDTEPTRRALRARGVRIGIGSDFAWDLRIHLARAGLEDLIDACVISCEAGREKPDPQLFLKACADLGARGGLDVVTGGW